MVWPVDPAGSGGLAHLAESVLNHRAQSVPDRAPPSRSAFASAAPFPAGPLGSAPACSGLHPNPALISSFSPRGLRMQTNSARVSIGCQATSDSPFCWPRSADASKQLYPCGASDRRLAGYLDKLLPFLSLGLIYFVTLRAGKVTKERQQQ